MGLLSSKTYTRAPAQVALDWSMVVPVVCIVLVGPRVSSLPVIVFCQQSYKMVDIQRIANYARFFDKLVSLVPAQHYHEKPEVVNVKYLHKQEKKLAKQMLKQQGKQNKRAKLDPETAKTALDVQQQQLQQLQQQRDAQNTASEPSGAVAAAEGSNTTGLRLQIGMTLHQHPAACKSNSLTLVCLSCVA